jgi:hypothetical protein
MPKVLEPNQAIQMIASGEPFRFTVPVLIQASADVIRNSDIQSAAVSVGKNVNPIVMIAHASQKIRDVSLRST